MRESDSQLHDLLEGDPLAPHAFVFTEGNKRLTLFVMGNQARTSVRNIKGVSRQTGSMTEVYSKARGVMQQVANTTGEPVYYTYFGKNRKLTAWARDLEKGKKIFRWFDEVSHEGQTIFYAEIAPEHDGV